MSSEQKLAADAVSMAASVDEFQKQILDLPVHPAGLPPDRLKFRIDHIVEEIAEIEHGHNNWSDTVDGFVDIIYIAMGALLEMGAEPVTAFNPVHNANMMKVRGVTRRGAHYDAIKPEGWQPPNHAAVYEALKLRAAVSPSLLEATRVVLERAAAYNAGSVRREDHFPFGMKSIFQMMWVKMIRMRSDLEAGRVVNRDHLVDLINYSDFGISHLDGRPL